MQRIQFLQQIASTFINKAESELMDYCFIFPNRRSGVFFEKYLKEEAGKQIILPKITTISEFVCDITGLVECGRIELMLDLYEEYVKLFKDNSESFDEFTYWGDVVINDFNDVDLYMVNAKELFRNVREYKEIGTDYLTDEQKAVLQEYFGVNESLYTSIGDRFWKHTSAYNANGENSQDYYKLWASLGELYDNLNKRLLAKGMAYSGRIYREAVQGIKQCEVKDFNCKQYVFVGFNVLSTSEIMLFKSLQNKGIVDFYWDCNSPALKDSNNKATKFISKNIERFKSNYDIGEFEIKSFPNIEIKAIPSSVGQVKYASSIVKHLIDDNKIDDKNDLIDTAIVLPDENLFIPLSGSIDKQNCKANITMGFPLKKSLTSTILSLIAKLHRQARKISGEWCYYHEDVKELLSHPFMKVKTQKESINLLAVVSKEKSSYIKSSLLLNECDAFKLLFSPIEEKTVEGLKKYMSTIMKFIVNEVISTFKDSNNGEVEKTCAQKYNEQFELLLDIIGNYNIEYSDSTFFYLLDRFVSGLTITMEGEPLEGLQIMGVLETRCLDFRNIIILSMNEKVFPKKHFSRSFIPHSIRTYYQMSTIEHQESMYAYYFYRMISRAENVYLLYDARSNAKGSGDPSRFVQQLCQIYAKDKAKIDFVSFDISIAKEQPIEVRKDEIKELLQEYRKVECKKFLSASAISTYIKCPLQFYFERVACLPAIEEDVPFIDYGTFGNIIHEIMRRLYKSAPKCKYNDVDAHKITESYISNLLNSTKLDDTITRVVNLKYNKLKVGEEAKELDGIGFMIYDVIKYYIKEILKFDKQNNPEFIYLQGETEESSFWSEFEINFKQFIDRVDIVKDAEGKDYVRIIDYKTGGDVKSGKLSEIFSIDNTQNNKVLMQLMLYCAYFNYRNDGKYEKIQPLVYTVKDMSKPQISIDGIKVDNYRNVYESFANAFRNKIEEIFDLSIPFTQTKHVDNCTYCKFKMICGR